MHIVLWSDFRYSRHRTIGLCASHSRKHLGPRDPVKSNATSRGIRSMDRFNRDSAPPWSLSAPCAASRCWRLATMTNPRSAGQAGCWKTARSGSSPIARRRRPWSGAGRSPGPTRPRRSACSGRALLSSLLFARRRKPALGLLRGHHQPAHPPARLPGVCGPGPRPGGRPRSQLYRGRPGRTPAYPAALQRQTQDALHQVISLVQAHDPLFRPPEQWLAALENAESDPLAEIAAMVR